MKQKTRYESRSGAVLYAKDVERVVAFYSGVLGLEVEARHETYVVLESPMFQLVVLQIPADIVSSITTGTPPTRRSMAPVKLVFFVPDITDTRTSVDAFGGVMNSADKEWSFQGLTVCDALDPEGNVIQFREQVG